MNYQHYQFAQGTCSPRRYLLVLRINTNLQKSAHAWIFCLPFSNRLYNDPLAPWNTVIVNLICKLNALYLRVYARSQRTSPQQLEHVNVLQFCHSVQFVSTVRLQLRHQQYQCTIVLVLLYNYFRGFTTDREPSLYTHALKCFFAEVPRIF